MSGTHDLSPEALAQYQADRGVFDVSTSAGNANYVYITRNHDDVVDVDFRLNPFIGAEIEKPDPILNPASVQPFQKPTLYASGFDRDGKRTYTSRTAQTFQPSQGFYQDLVTLQQTGFKFDAFEFLIPPEATTTFHSHTNGVELFYVLGGEPANDDNPGIPDNDEVIFELNADVDGVFNLADPQNPFSVVKDDEIELNGVKVTKGSFVAVPAGKIHTWANTGLIPATVIALIVPGGIADGFQTVGADGGIYDPSPPVHPILEQNGTSNLIPTGVTPTEVNGVVPGDPNFYDFFQQVAINPGVLEQLSFTDFPTYLQDAGPVAVYGVNADGSGAFKLAPSDDAGTGGVANPNGGSALQGDDSPGIDAITDAPVDPFSDSTFTNPFTVLRFGQNDGILNPTPIETKLFSISSEEGEYSVTSLNHELFGVLNGELIFEFGENGNSERHLQIVGEGDYVYVEPGNHFHLWASDQLNSSSAQLIQFSGLTQDLSSSVTAFQSSGDDESLGSLAYDISSANNNAAVQANSEALDITDADFHNLIGLYPILDGSGLIQATTDVTGDGIVDVNDVLMPGDAGYAFTAISNRVNNFELQLGAKGDPLKNTTAEQFGVSLLNKGALYAPFVIANGGNLIPQNGSINDGIEAFLTQNPNNDAATLENFTEHSVAYFSFAATNPDGVHHLQSRGDNTFGFEDLPGNLGISDFDFNDAPFKFSFNL